MNKLAELINNLLYVVVITSVIATVFVIAIAVKIALQFIVLKRRTEIYMAMTLLIEQGTEEDKEKLSNAKYLLFNDMNKNKILTSSIIKEMNQKNLAFLVPYFKQVVKENLINKKRNNG